MTCYICQEGSSKDNRLVRCLGLEFLPAVSAKVDGFNGAVERTEDLKKGVTAFAKQAAKTYRCGKTTDNEDRFFHPSCTTGDSGAAYVNKYITDYKSKHHPKFGQLAVNVKAVHLHMCGECYETAYEEPQPQVFLEEGDIHRRNLKKQSKQRQTGASKVGEAAGPGGLVMMVEVTQAGNVLTRVHNKEMMSAIPMLQGLYLSFASAVRSVVRPILVPNGGNILALPPPQSTAIIVGSGDCDGSNEAQTLEEGQPTTIDPGPSSQPARHGQRGGQRGGHGQRRGGGGERGAAATHRASVEAPESITNRVVDVGAGAHPPMRQSPSSPRSCRLVGRCGPGPAACARSTTETLP